MTQTSSRALTFNEYQGNSGTTGIYRKQAEWIYDNLSREEVVDLLGLMYVGLGLSGEAGEVAGKIKKIFRDNDGRLDPEKAVPIRQEIGGVLWYAAAVSSEIDRSNVAAINAPNYGMDKYNGRGTLEGAARENLEILARRQQQGTLKGDGDERGTKEPQSITPDQVGSVEDALGILRDNSENDE